MAGRLVRLMVLGALVLASGCGGDGGGTSGPPTMPNAPGNVQIVVSDTTVTISWDVSSGATSYNIYWNTTGNVTTSDTKIAGAASPYMHTNLTNGTTYYYAVTAANAGGESSISAEVSAVPHPWITIAASKDNTLYEDVGGAWSNGAGNHMFAGVTLGPGSGGQSGEPAEIRRALLAFDVANSGIPAGSTVDSVFLVLNVSHLRPLATNIEVHKVSADWGEGTSAPLSPNEGGGTTPTTGDATWIHTFFATSFWTTPGGDFSATVSATTAVNTLGFHTWGSTTNMVADVQSWLGAPAGNFGWILVGDESTDGTATRFDTRTNGTVANRPALIVHYTRP